MPCLGLEPFRVGRQAAECPLGSLAAVVLQRICSVSCTAVPCHARMSCLSARTPRRNSCGPSPSKQRPWALQAFPAAVARPGCLPPPPGQSRSSWPSGPGTARHGSAPNHHVARRPKLAHQPFLRPSPALAELLGHLVQALGRLPGTPAGVYRSATGLNLRLAPRSLRCGGLAGARGF